MSGVASIMNSALRSMETATQALAVASNNIANEGTPGYARQRLIVQPAPNEGDMMLTGSGVEAVRIEAIRDLLLENRLRDEISSETSSDLLHSKLRDVEILFNDIAETGMLGVITEFFNSFHDLALDPASINAREQVQTAAENLAQSFQTRGDQLRQMQTVADKDLVSYLENINSLAKRIAGLAKDIQVQEVGGQNANSLRNQRTALVNELSQYIGVNELEGADGNYRLSIGSTLFVFDGQTVPLTWDTSATGGFVSVKLGSVDVSSTVTSGRVFAQQQIRDKFVPDYISKLDQLAYEITTEVNAIHSVSYDRSGNTGVNFFDPLASASSAARLIKLNSAISTDPTKIAAAKLVAGTDNQAATDIGNLTHKQVFTGGSVIDQYRSLVFTIGNDTTNVGGELDHHAALLHQLRNRRDSISGVSADEETMDILRFQRAYQASASLIRIVDELLQTILSMVVR